MLLTRIYIVSIDVNLEHCKKVIFTATREAIEVLTQFDSVIVFLCA